MFFLIKCIFRQNTYLSLFINTSFKIFIYSFRYFSLPIHILIKYFYIENIFFENVDTLVEETNSWSTGCQNLWHHTDRFMYSVFNATFTIPMFYIYHKTLFYLTGAKLCFMLQWFVSMRVTTLLCSSTFFSNWSPYIFRMPFRGIL